MICWSIDRVNQWVVSLLLKCSTRSHLGLRYILSLTFNCNTSRCKLPRYQLAFCNRDSCLSALQSSSSPFSSSQPQRKYWQPQVLVLGRGQKKNFWLRLLSEDTRQKNEKKKITKVVLLRSLLAGKMGPRARCRQILVKNGNKFRPQTGPSQ